MLDHDERICLRSKINKGKEVKTIKSRSKLQPLILQSWTSNSGGSTLHIHVHRDGGRGRDNDDRGSDCDRDGCASLAVQMLQRKRLLQRAVPLLRALLLSYLCLN